MGRLIDAEEAKIAITGFLLNCVDKGKISFDITEVQVNVFKIINNQPTAYSVEKVVEELEGSLVEGMSGVSFTKNAMEIIDIVKGGGLDE